MTIGKRVMLTIGTVLLVLPAAFKTINTCVGVITLPGKLQQAYQTTLVWMHALEPFTNTAVLAVAAFVVWSVWTSNQQRTTLLRKLGVISGDEAKDKLLSEAEGLISQFRQALKTDADVIHTARDGYEQWKRRLEEYAADKPKLKERLLVWRNESHSPLQMGRHSSQEAGQLVVAMKIITAAE